MVSVVQQAMDIASWLICIDCGKIPGCCYISSLHKFEDILLVIHYSSPANWQFSQLLCMALKDSNLFLQRQYVAYDLEAICSLHPESFPAIGKFTITNKPPQWCAKLWPTHISTQHAKLCYATYNACPPALIYWCSHPYTVQLMSQYIGALHYVCTAHESINRSFLP